MFDSLFRILEQLPPMVAVSIALLILAALFFLALVKFAIQLLESQRAHRARQNIANVSPCNVPPHVVEALRAAIELQKEDVAAREASDTRAIESRARLETAITELTRIINRGAEKLAVWMASQRRGGD